METSNPNPQLGHAVIYHDPVGTPHDALVTAVWSPTYINVVFVSGDDTKQDPYGRQIERSTSTRLVKSAYRRLWMPLSVASRVLLLFAGHALCDYPLQGDFLARGKNHCNPIPISTSSSESAVSVSMQGLGP
jgi:hypothetical protein